MNEPLKVTSLNFVEKEFVVDDFIAYPILFEVDGDITTEDFQKGLDKAKEIILNIFDENE